MKKILTSIIIIISIKSFGQADTIVTNLNVKASVVNTIAGILKGSDDVRFVNAFIKFTADYRDGAVPTDNNNVNIDTVYTDVLIYVYGSLRENVYTQTAFTDFSSDITSKRNTNTRLDTGCDNIDAGFAVKVAAEALRGKRLLTGKSNTQ